MPPYRWGWKPAKTKESMEEPQTPRARFARAFARAFAGVLVPVPPQEYKMMMYTVINVNSASLLMQAHIEWHKVECTE
jgi:hypothetical protein